MVLTWIQNIINNSNNDDFGNIGNILSTMIFQETTMVMHH